MFQDSLSENDPRVCPKPDLITNGLGSIESNQYFSRMNGLSLLEPPDELSNLKLKPFKKLDPTLRRNLFFLDCFAVTVNHIQSNSNPTRPRYLSFVLKYVKILLMFIICIISLEVVYDLNVKQSKLSKEQKRAAPLLTFVIIVYSTTTLVQPIMSDIFLIIIGSPLFRFYSRTTTTVSNGHFFGRKTFVDNWLYYTTLVIVAFLDALGQFIVGGIWPQWLDPIMNLATGKYSSYSTLPNNNNNNHIVNGTFTTLVPFEHELMGNSSINYSEPDMSKIPSLRPKIHAFLLDSILGEKYAHSELGISLKLLCLMIQFIHSNAFFILIVSLANHYATIIKDLNENLERLSSRRLLKQLIILRDSCEQISIIISIPFALNIQLAFSRQIALIGVYIQSTMMPYENWAVLLQAITCGLTLFTVFIYCDGLQGESRHLHRLKTEQTVIDDNEGGDQSIYEFLDYLNRLSQSIRITLFNIIAINKHTLVTLYSQCLTITFVTS